MCLVDFSYLSVWAVGNAVWVKAPCNGKAMLSKGTLHTTIIIGGAVCAQSREIVEILGYNLEWKQATREVL